MKYMQTLLIQQVQSRSLERFFLKQLKNGDFTPIEYGFDNVAYNRAIQTAERT